jgi:head-tail adaptor
MIAGRMRHKISVYRRAVVAGDPAGMPRGDFELQFTTRAWLKAETGAKASEAGLAEDQARALLRIYDCARNRTITAADRITVNGESWSIETIAPPDITRDLIELVIVRKIGG